MHDIWNPWHGCKKISEGCDHCYMYCLDKSNGKSGRNIYRTKANFTYPMQKDRQGNYKIKSGELIRVCMSSDFFLEEADEWREEAWKIMQARRDVKFFLLTKRPQRVEDCLPMSWRNGKWSMDNIFLNVTCENQRRADERIPILLELPFKHRGIMCAPFIGKVDINTYLSTGQIEQVICGGENYDGLRPCNFEWVKLLRQQCETYQVSFTFIETGTNFLKDGKSYHLPKKIVQSEMAYKSGMNYIGKEMNFLLCDSYGRRIEKENLYVPHFTENCKHCGSRQICNGCSDCGKCNEGI